MDVNELDIAVHFGQVAVATTYLVGVIVSIVLWSKAPRTCLLVFLAASMMLAVELLFITMWLLPDHDWDDSDAYQALNVIDSFGRLIGFVLLAVAAFTHRPRPQPRYPDFDDDHINR